MPVVELAGVTKAYESEIAVRDLSISIDAGQIFGLLGPNGAGKTSSIRMMMGITLPDSGRINLFEKPFDRKSLDHVGYLPEERGLYKKMNVLDQLIFFGQLHGVAKEDARKRALNWATRMEISDALDKKTQELSKGMQQKIQFIATLLHDPGLIVMDEPFSGLDPVNTTLLQDALLELKGRGKAILFSTHRMDQVEKLCDSICLVDHGEAVLSGRMREIKSRYERNRIIIEFEGNADFLKSEEIAEANNYTGHAEIKLKPRGDAQKLLHQAASQARIYRFELVEPSLEEIFIETVGGKADA
jgi:ABC-2 type transport system ATP-binding protein